MIAVLLIAHAPLASSLQAVAAHVFSECSAQVSALDVAAGESADDVLARALDRIAAIGGDVLILADVFGATPCNALQRLSVPDHVQVVAGVNVPMLWRALCYLDHPGETLESLARRAFEGGRQGVMQVTFTPPQNQPPKAGHDPDNDHDQ